MLELSSLDSSLEFIILLPSMEETSTMYKIDTILCIAPTFGALFYLSINEIDSKKHCQNGTPKFPVKESHATKSTSRQIQ